MYDFLKCIYTVVEMGKLRSVCDGLEDFQLSELLQSEISHPPIILDLLIVVNSFLLESVGKFWMVGNIRCPAQISVMKHDDLVIFCKMHIKFDQIRTMETSYYCLEGILWKNRA